MPTSTYGTPRPRQTVVRPSQTVMAQIVSVAWTQQVDDNAAVTDALTFRLVKSIADPAAGTDAQAKAVVHLIADPAAGTDSLSKRIAPAAQADAAGITDSLSDVWHATVAIVEALVVTDAQSFSTTGHHALTFNEPMAMTDLVAPTFHALRTVSDLAAVTDAQTKTGTKLVAEALAGSDALSRAWTVLRAVDDVGYLADGLDFQKHLDRWLGDTDNRWPGDTDGPWPDPGDDKWPGGDDSRWPAAAEDRW